MTNKQLKKRKERERRVADKMYRRRQGKIKAEREKRQWEEKMEAEFKAKSAPSYLSSAPAQQKPKMSATEIEEKLQSNLELLQKLEEEYRKNTGKELADELKKTDLAKATAVTDAVEKSLPEVDVEKEKNISATN